MITANPASWKQRASSLWKLSEEFGIALCLALVCCRSASATEPSVPAVVPFISGFDRFGRHADIDPEMAGRLLITELSCTACHASSDDRLIPKRGPVLDGAGNRLRTDWIREFLLSPSTARHGTTMPDMLANLPVGERMPAATALTAFLSSLRQEYPEIKASALNPVPPEFWSRGNVERGRQLYHQIGCVACHAPDESHTVIAAQPSPLDELLDQLEPEELKELGLSSAARRVHFVPHPQLAAKYGDQSLTFFLLNPELTRPAGRMPNFSLRAVDAADIAAWLLRDSVQTRVLSASSTPENVTADITQIALGRQLFTELRCNACHQIKGMTADSTASPFAMLNLTSSTTCIVSPLEVIHDADVKGKKGQPTLLLDQAQQNAIASVIVAFGNLPKTNNTADARADELTLILLQQNCFACHERDTLGGVNRFLKPYFETAGHVDIGDEGRLPPALTGVGSRLTTAWMTSVLTGKGNVRPFMTIRMPVFPASLAKPLPEMFAKVEDSGRHPPATTDVFAHAENSVLVDAGRQLMDTGCVQCHAFKGESLPGTVGVDLHGVTTRMQSQWLHDFLKDPGSLRPRTRMPTFFPNGKSQNRNVLNGDTELQIAAMYAYMKDLDNQPLPEKIQQARAQNYELTPIDRPIVLRTFMPVVGTHAIAVGFPQHVHFAFDAEHIAPAQAWRGRFLDAEGTWFVRFTPPAEPLGDDLIELSPGISVAVLESHESPWPADATAAGAKYSGYRLDKSGAPTFLYRVGDFDIEDRIEPEEGGLNRTIAIVATVDSDLDSGSDYWGRLWIRASKGHTLKQRTPQTVVNEEGLAVTVQQSVDPGEIRTVGDTSEWILPIIIGKTADSEATIRVEYRW